MNKLFGDVNATSDGIIGTQTASHPVTHPAIHPSADNLSSDNLPAIDLMAENKPMESQQIKKEPIEKKLGHSHTSKINLQHNNVLELKLFRW
ncbi:hypothetical protein DFH28DRAFT_1118818 [Melampsora americana]|nr:hypothetical protein DFH28DRAFT_1118818 [Melampsora americana]